jgi:hypothetical protein
LNGDGVSFLSSFRRLSTAELVKPVSRPFCSSAVIPAQAGLSTAEPVIHFDLLFEVQSFVSPAASRLLLA